MFLRDSAGEVSASSCEFTRFVAVEVEAADADA